MPHLALYRFVRQLVSYYPHSSHDIIGILGVILNCKFGGGDGISDIAAKTSFHVIVPLYMG